MCSANADTGSRFREGRIPARTRYNRRSRAIIDVSVTMRRGPGRAQELRRREQAGGKRPKWERSRMRWKCWSGGAVQAIGTGMGGPAIGGLQCASVQTDRGEGYHV